MNELRMAEVIRRPSQKYPARQVIACPFADIRSSPSGKRFLDVALFLPFGSNKEQQTAARRDTKRRSKIVRFCSDAARRGNVQQTAAKDG